MFVPLAGMAQRLQPAYFIIFSLFFFTSRCLAGHVEVRPLDFFLF